MSLHIVRMAAGSTLQDQGRPGWRRFGVPPGGAFDRESYALALALVGRSEGAALEVPLMGGEFVALADDVVAVVGAFTAIRLDGREKPGPGAFAITAGQRLSFDPPRHGARVYVASAGGWPGTIQLGSLSNQPPTVEAAKISIGWTISAPVRLDRPPDSMRDRPLRVLPGPQWRESDGKAMASGVFAVGLSSNRLGVRLKGGTFEAAAEMRSEPSCLGSVQLTPSGELIVHGPDGPTLGGYPKIAAVIEADLDRLAQLRPGDAARFEWVNREEADTARRERLRRIETLVCSIRVARR